MEENSFKYFFPTGIDMTAFVSSGISRIKGIEHLYYDIF